MNARLGPLNPVAIDSAGEHVAAGNIYGSVWVWDLTDGLEQLVATKAASASSLAFTQQLAPRCRHERWPNRTLGLAKRREPSRNIVTGGGVALVEWSPDGTQLAGGLSDGEIIVWDSETLDPIVTLSGHLGQVWDVAFSPDGTRIASAARTARRASGTSRIGASFGSSSGTRAGSPRSPTAMMEQMVVTGDSGGMVGFWDIETGRPLRAHSRSRRLGQRSRDPERRFGPFSWRRSVAAYTLLRGLS